MLSLSTLLSDLHDLPRGFLQFTGAVNLVYSSYSFSLAVRGTRPMLLIKLLVFGNVGWAVVCLSLAARFSASATLFGMGHLVGEAIFVGGMAALEWRQRDELQIAS